MMVWGVKLNSEFYGSVFGLLGAALISIGNDYGFFAFLFSNICFLFMAAELKLRPFFLLQLAFMLTSFVGIYNNFL